MELFEKERNLEDFMRKQERLLKENQVYSRLMFIPIIVIIVSSLVLAYNLTVGNDLIDKEPLSVSVEETEQVAAIHNSLTTEEKSRMLNLNAATVEELDSLPGIGAEKAKSIIDTRERMGGFRSVEDVLNADGIGEKLLEQIREYAFVE